QADAVEVAEPDKAIGFLREASGWFQDASRLRPDDEEPRANLEKVLKRIQILADKLNQDGGIAGRLDTLLGDQRAIQGQIRELLTRLDAQNVTDPVAFRGDFGAVATRQRALVADLGTLIDLAGEERDLIAQKDDKERTDQDRVRQVQLDAALRHLERARTEMADTRRELRRLAAKTALSDAATALDALKRAREQLLDPIAVLRTLAGEELQLYSYSAQLAELGNNRLLEAGPAPKAPPWLSGERLSEQQQLLTHRTTELSLRLTAADASQLPADVDPKQKRLIEAAQKAAPMVARAEGHMKDAASRLSGGDFAGAAELQKQAAEALLEAAELFADVRSLIELTYQGHRKAVALLTPAEGDAPAPELSTAERAQQVGEQTSKTAIRLERLDALLSEELAAIDAAIQQAQGQGQQAKGQGQQANPAEQAEAEKQRVQRATELRAKAADAITRLRQALDERSPQALAIAVEAQTHLEELRRLYFSIVEHLKELHQRQSETRDRTAEADSKDDAGKGPAAGQLETRQREHIATGEAIAKALEGQADAAGQAQDPKAAEQAEKLGQAAGEVRKALMAMDDAATALATAVEEAKAASVSLQPTVDSEQTAIDHLAEAIKLLQPPPEQDQKQEQQQDQEQEQQDQKKEQQQGQGQQAQPKNQKLSQQEAQRRLQAIREREAERRKERQQVPTDPVEKDW
ncbi:MAG: hypothetical protein KJO07_25525, partial [Deltaproteobacteria bacterium]|nr:hypothetical protein [Deltaproteobacteria bacterium]